MISLRIFNDGFSSLSLQRGNLYLPVNFTIKDSKIYYSNIGYGNPFIVDPSKRNYLALKGLRENTEVELFSEEKLFIKLKQQIQVQMIMLFLLMYLEIYFLK